MCLRSPALRWARGPGVCPSYECPLPGTAARLAGPVCEGWHAAAAQPQASSFVSQLVGPFEAGGVGLAPSGRSLRPGSGSVPFCLIGHTRVTMSREIKGPELLVPCPGRSPFPGAAWSWVPARAGCPASLFPGLQVLPAAGFHGAPFGDRHQAEGLKVWLG